MVVNYHTTTTTTTTTTTIPLPYHNTTTTLPLPPPTTPTIPPISLLPPLTPQHHKREERTKEGRKANHPNLKNQPFIYTIWFLMSEPKCFIGRNISSCFWRFTMQQEIKQCTLTCLVSSGFTVSGENEPREGASRLFSLGSFSPSTVKPSFTTSESKLLS